MYAVQKAARLKRIAEDPIPATYVHSGQKLQYTELAKAKTRGTQQGQELYLRAFDE